LIADILGTPLNEEDALVVMILLHTHGIGLTRPVLSDPPGVTDLAAITQRHAAEVVAGLWPDRADPDRTNYAWWYWRFNTQVPFESIDDVPHPCRGRVKDLRRRLEGHPLVACVRSED
jgi:hypothetical protein